MLINAKMIRTEKKFKLRRKKCNELILEENQKSQIKLKCPFGLTKQSAAS
jgi:phage FluMu protein Com